MSRVIKFRAWDTKENKYFEPIYEAYKGQLLDMHITLSGQPCIRSIEHCSDMRETERYLLEQFTGLHDKNGKEIYEGDLLGDQYESVGLVIWNQDSASFLVEYGDELQSIDDGDLAWSEIIGNIHENSELLQ